MDQSLVVNEVIGSVQPGELIADQPAPCTGEAVCPLLPIPE